MENASQALIIAGTVLLAMLVLSVGLYLVVNYTKVSESYEEKKAVEEIRKFNTNFTKFVTRTDITAQEIITLKNFAKSYDEKNGTSTTVNYQGNNDDIVFIKDNTPEEVGGVLVFHYFTCNETNVKYDETGRINSITFTAN